KDSAVRSNTSVCLEFAESAIASRAPEERRALANKMVERLEAERAAYDIGAYRLAPPGLRIWCGPTVETHDVELLTPWLDWAYATARKELT
ncbi:MAG: phosphoserine aminotransferase, partial [Methylovirgula sp.]